VRADQITDPVTFHGEGATWHSGWGGLKWVDMFAGDVLSLHPDESVTRLATGSTVAAMVRPRRSGGFVVALENRFGFWDESGSLTLGPELWSGGQRFNEGGCTPDGALLCGALTDARETGSGRLWRLETDGSATPVLDDVTISNGLGFTSDGTRMYYVDTPTGRIDIFDYIDGSLVGRRPFASIETGFPDGLCVDSEDGVWVALYGGSAVQHFDSTGALTETVELPVTNVTSCTLGGDDLRTLYITTSRENLTDDEEPLAGSLFSVRVGVAGLPVLLADV
jgi:sugar lactone lactonase YvrE